MIGLLNRFFVGAFVALMALMPGAALAQLGYAEPGQLGFQESVTPTMDTIIAFHDGLLMWIISIIVLIVFLLMLFILVRFNRHANPTPSKRTHNVFVEIVWTVAPILILVLIAVPSFGVLADQETIPDGIRKYMGANLFSSREVDVPAPGLTIKVTGVQWSWDYEYVDFGENASFSSLMLNEEDRQRDKPNQPRLLAVDNELVVPVDTTVRVQVTAADVIHAFAVPSFGVKIDAVPGRLNQTWFNARKTGIYYGQCSELCGKDHAFMPIAVRVVEKNEFKAWMDALKDSDVESANLKLAAVN